MAHTFKTPKQVVEAGEKIYAERYKAQYEADQLGKYVAIDVETAKAYVGETAAEALDTARKDAPLGTFHLMKIGSAGAFRESYSLNANLDWIFR
jgi:hypothetical protein